MAQVKAQKAVAAASSEGTIKQPIVELTPAAAAAVRKLLQVLLLLQTHIIHCMYTVLLPLFNNNV
jgi:hypothetical protein